MSLPYSDCLLHRNSLNLDLDYPEKSFQPGDSNGLKEIYSKANSKLFGAISKFIKYL